MQRMMAEHAVTVERLLTRIQGFAPPPIPRSTEEIQKGLAAAEEFDEKDGALIAEFQLEKNALGAGFMGPDGVLYDTVKDAVIELKKKNWQPKGPVSRIANVGEGGNGSAG